MVAKKYQEIIAWQLADALRKRVIELSERDAFKRDFRLCSQMRAAAGSVTSNIAEGFKRFNPPEFAQFMKYARASLAEVNTHLDDARDRGYIKTEEHAAACHLAARTAIASARLHAYLRRAKAPKPKN